MPSTKFKHDCCARRWRCAVAPSFKLSSGCRGGVAVLHRAGFDSIKADIIIPGQAVACWIHLAQVGVVVFVSYYGHPLKDDKDKKREEIKLIARYLAGTGHPYVLGGDFNEDGKVIQDMLEDAGVPAVVNVSEG